MATAMSNLKRVHEVEEAQDYKRLHIDDQLQPNCNTNSLSSRSPCTSPWYYHTPSPHPHQQQPIITPETTTEPPPLPTITISDNQPVEIEITGRNSPDDSIRMDPREVNAKSRRGGFSLGFRASCA
eukprot:Ihof_evm5s375 gene=Ihof_evmTU5s375